MLSTATTINPPITRRQILKTAGAALPLLALPRPGQAASQRAESVSLALDWYPNANHAGLFLASERGYFAAAGIELDAYTPSDPTTVLQTIGAGRDDFGISYQTDVLLARAQGVPVVSVAALVQVPLVGVMTLSEAGVRTPADLVGKTIGYPGIPSQAAFLDTMLEGVDQSIDDVDLINIGFNLVSTLISGQVDAVLGAYWTHETLLAEKEGYPVDFLRVEAWGVPSYYELVIVASEDTVANRTDLVRSMLAALQAGYTNSIAEPDAALAALASSYPEIDEGVERQGIELLTPVWISVAPFFGFQSDERWKGYAAWMASRDLIPTDLDIEAAYDATLMPTEAGTPTAG